MAKYVPDSNTERWVIIAPTRQKRPEDTGEKKTSACPFCPGNEAMTPPEVYRIGSGEPNQPGWQVRVIPNKYPITDIHEVIIHSPSHEQDIEELPLEQVTKILTSYRDRYRAFEDDGQVLIFCNHGFHAGASLTHPHSQLVVLPKQINLDALSREPVNNIIKENTHFVTYCPDFSQWPFEVWVAPKTATGKFSEVGDREIPDLAAVFQDALRRIEAVHDQGKLQLTHGDGLFVYNFYFYHGTNWYLRITPRFIHRAGFELGTGLSVNVADPTTAAQILREVDVSWLVR